MKKISIAIAFLVLLSSCSNDIIKEADSYNINNKNIATSLIRAVNDENKNFRTSPLVASRNMHYILLAATLIFSTENSEINKKEALAEALSILGMYLYKFDKKINSLFYMQQYLGNENINNKSKKFGRTIAEKIIKLAKNDNYEEIIYKKIEIDDKIKYKVIDKYKWRPTGREEPGLEPNWGYLNSFIEVNKECLADLPDIDKIIKEAKLMAINYSESKAVSEIVLWWLAGVGTDTPSGQWMSILGNLLKNANKSEFEKIMIASIAASSNFDVSIQLWREKYKYNILRPETLWKEIGYNIILPRETPNHPSYPSGHSGFATSTGSVIKHFFGNIPIYSNLPADLYYSAQRRDWGSVDEAISEAGESRVVSGFHYPLDIIAGNKIGNCVAINTIKKYDIRIESMKI